MEGGRKKTDVKEFYCLRENEDIKQIILLSQVSMVKI